MSDTSDLAQQYAGLASSYAEYAKRFEPGSAGWIGNMAESEKYAGLAARVLVVQS